MSKIYAGFESMLSARRAIEKLNALGLGKAYLDAFDKYQPEYSEEINFAGSHNAPSLSALVLKSGSHLSNAGKGPLTAADPMVSGMGSYEEIARNIVTKLIVNLDENNKPEVQKLISDLGGTLYER